jgi:hypothetical protein
MLIVSSTRLPQANLKVLRKFTRKKPETLETLRNLMNTSPIRRTSLMATKSQKNAETTS